MHYTTVIAEIFVCIISYCSAELHASSFTVRSCTMEIVRRMPVSWLTGRFASTIQLSVCLPSRDVVVSKWHTASRIYTEAVRQVENGCLLHALNDGEVSGPCAVWIVSAWLGQGTATSSWRWGGHSLLESLAEREICSRKRQIWKEFNALTCPDKCQQWLCMKKPSNRPQRTLTIGCSVTSHCVSNSGHFDHSSLCKHFSILKRHQNASISSFLALGNFLSMLQQLLSD